MSYDSALTYIIICILALRDTKMFTAVLFVKYKNLKIAQMSINYRMDKHIVIKSYKGTLFRIEYE